MERTREKRLERFPDVEGLPLEKEEKRIVLGSSGIKKVVLCALGPEGTNISQACRRWAEKMGISEKTEVKLCDTPELSLKEAQKVQEKGVLAVFWTCAVYAHEAEFFFTNPKILPFFFTEVMDLDEMQIATREDLPVEKGKIPEEWKIASHPSPVHLVRNLECEKVIVTSNGEAARVCKAGEVEICVTTESARKIYGLKKIHLFGSPPMVFFGGITPHGIKVIKKVLSHSKG